MGVSLLGLKSGRLEVFRNLRFCILGLAAAFASVPAVVSANPGDYETVFEFTGTGGAINDFAVHWFSAHPTDDANPLYGDAANRALNDLTDPRIFLELEITGLSHTSPMDLNIFLLDPFGTGIEIMDDRGDQQPLNNVTLFFRDQVDGGKPLPADPGALIDQMVYQPELPGTPSKQPGFSGYTTTGADAWRLVIIDDSSGDEGTFRSFTIRGLIVPEPATLSLLAIGACALIRRRKA